MAEFQPILAFILKHEDASGKGEVTTDSGGRTRFGLAQRYNPDLTDENFYDLPAADALLIAGNRYLTKYVDPFHLLELDSQAVASKVADCMVNPGPGFVKTVQEIAGVAQDGAIGPVTIGKLNSLFPDAVVTALCAAQADHYREEAKIAAAAGRSYPLKGLLIRAADKPPEG